MKTRWVATLSLLAFFAGSAWLAVHVKNRAERSKKTTKVHEKEKAPDFSLPSLDGKTLSLSEQKGRLVVLNFWATWCGPCRAEMPDLEKFYVKHKDSLVFFAVNQKEKTDTVKAFIRKKGYSFPVLLDEDGKVSERYGVSAIPTTFVIAPNGKVLSVHVGSLPHPERSFRRFVKKYAKAPAKSGQVKTFAEGTNASGAKSP